MKQRTKDYLIRFSPDVFEDLENVKKLDNRTLTSLIHEGCRLVVKQKLQDLTSLRKNRETLSGMVAR
tara:strand:+ start:582 stop:782 length:201 start_codon:yes stop_codon:yes gene_type:complete